MRTRLLGWLGWLLAVVVATTTGLTAISLLTEGLTSEAVAPLSQDAVSRDLASTTPAKAAPTTPASSAHPPSDRSTQTRAFGSAGGTVIARCTGNRSYLVSWSPASGWSVDEHKRGPARSTMVTFEGDSDAADDRDVTITVTCRAGEPVHTAVTTDD